MIIFGNVAFISKACSLANFYTRGVLWTMEAQPFGRKGQLNLVTIIVLSKAQFLIS